MNSVTSSPGARNSQQSSFGRQGSEVLSAALRHQPWKLQPGRRVLGEDHGLDCVSAGELLCVVVLCVSFICSHRSFLRQCQEPCTLLNRLQGKMTSRNSTRTANKPELHPHARSQTVHVRHVAGSRAGPVQVPGEAWPRLKPVRRNHGAAHMSRAT